MKIKIFKAVEIKKRALHTHTMVVAANFNISTFTMHQKATICLFLQKLRKETRAG